MGRVTTNTVAHGLVHMLLRVLMRVPMHLMGHAVIQGYAFCEYQYPEVTDVVIDSLNLKPVGSKTLTVKRAVNGHPGISAPTLPQMQLPPAVTNAYAVQQHRLQQPTQALLMGPARTML